MDLTFYINKYKYLIIGIVLISFFTFSIICYYKSKKNEKELENFFKSIISCSIYDFKHKVNKHEVAAKNK